MKTSTEESTRLIAAVLQQQLRDVGIALEVRSFEFATFFADVSKNVTFVGNFTNLVNSCFGGTKVAWAVSGACGYGVVGGGTAGDVGNMYNPGAVIQPYVNTPYEPFFTGLPFGMYFSAKIRI